MQGCWLTGAGGGGELSVNWGTNTNTNVDTGGARDVGRDVGCKEEEDPQSAAVRGAADAACQSTGDEGITPQMFLVNITKAYLGGGVVSSE